MKDRESRLARIRRMSPGRHCPIHIPARSLVPIRRVEQGSVAPLFLVRMAVMRVLDVRVGDATITVNIHVLRLALFNIGDHCGA